MLTGCTLTKDRPSVEWSYNNEDGEYHSLVLKQVDFGFNFKSLCSLNKKVIDLPVD